MLDERLIFCTACHIEARDARSAYLKQACAEDQELLARLERLLRAYDNEAFLQLPAVPEISCTPAVLEGAGTQIGPYKLIEKIGEGGFGVVFVADQQQPVRRRVALKIVKPGMDTRDVVARFEAERQALAMMDHPNIAHVFDGGTTDSGRPYFVMELVKGVPITQYCDEHELTPHDRLLLIEAVCLAVQHAHQKGVIHRDLKPTNVLVAAYDGAPVPKIIDFGVAKALGERLTDRTLVTSFGGIIGTLEYMSPEQAEFNARDVDTRADIYSLGVLLYELLTSTTPLTRERLKQAAMIEALRLIREEEPPKPSTRVSESSRTRAAVSPQRKLEPERLARELRGDLDWIVMKALEKDRDRRYQTANGLARDIERYLREEPVEACPPSAQYRLRKLLRRHRGPAAAVCTVLAVLVGGMATTSWGFLSARAAQRRAEENQRRAEENFDIAKNAVDDYLNIADAPEVKRSDFNALRKKLLESAVPFYQRLAERKPGDAAQEAARGLAYGRLGDLRRQMGEAAEALADYERMRSIFAKLADDLPTVSEYRHRLASSHGAMGDLLIHLGRDGEAESAHRAALAIHEKLAADFPAAPEYRAGLATDLSNLGLVLDKTGQRDEAVAAYRAAVDTLEKLAADFPTVPEYREADSRHRLGRLLTSLRKRDEAESAYRAAVDNLGKLAADFPTVPKYREDLSFTHHDLGTLLRLHKPEEAEAAFRAAQAIQKQLAADFPTVPKYRSDLAKTRHELGRLLRGISKHDEAEAVLRAALPTLEKLADDFPTVPEYREQLAEARLNLGILMRDVGKRDESEASYRAALASYEKLAADFPTVPVYRSDLAITGNCLATLLSDLGKYGEAEAAFRAALPVWETLAADFPTVPSYRDSLAATRRDLGLLLTRLARKGQWKEAAAGLARAIELDPKDHDTAFQLGFLLAEEGDLPAYQEYCRTMLSRWGKVTDPMIAERTAKACLLLAGGAPDPGQLAGLLQTALSVDEKDELYKWSLFAKGLHDYRCGRFADAGAACGNSRQRAASEPALTVTDQMVEAMSLYGLGKTDAAREVLAAAARLLDEKGKKLESGDLDDTWPDWLCCRILLREASALIDR